MDDSEARPSGHHLAPRRQSSLKFSGPTMSVAAPETAALIRSEATGALKPDKQTGLFCFENTVNTTFILPWDLNPRVQPVRFSESMRTGIRAELMDAAVLSTLENSGVLNWNTSVEWSAMNPATNLWEPVAGNLFVELERLYHTAENVCALPHLNCSVDFVKGILCVVEGHAQVQRQMRRLECSPMVPLKVDEGDGHSLFHAASMGFWGVHDRTNLLRDAVQHSLTDFKAQFVLLKRWSECTRRQAAASGIGIGDPSQEQWEEAKRTTPQLYLFILANITKRPIIVYAPPQSDIGGIYLPLMWKNPMSHRYPCDDFPNLKNPLVLGFDSSRQHFVSLATFKGDKGPNLILLPLVYCDNRQLPVHYLSNEELPRQDDLLLKMLNVHYHKSSDPTVNVAPGSPIKDSLPLTLHSQKGHIVPTAVLDTPAMPEVLESLMKRFEALFL